MEIEPKAVWKRILDAFGQKKPPEIARTLGIEKQAVYKWRDGGIPGLDTLTKICASTGVSLHWLLYGEGPKRISESRSWEIANFLQYFDERVRGRLVEAGRDYPFKGDYSSPMEVANWIISDSINNHNEGESPVYFGEKEREIILELAQESDQSFDEQVRYLVLESLKARGLITDQVQGVDLLFFGREVPTLKAVRLWGEIAAGKPLDVFEEFETVLVPEEFLTVGRENFALRVRGDSMEDEGILEGDIIICYESHVANNGDTVVALIDGSQATVKKFYIERKQIRLQPKSKKHEPIFLSPERVQIQGIVTGIFRRTV